jgi:hypothetical protein
LEEEEEEKKKARQPTLQKYFKEKLNIWNEM